MNDLPGPNGDGFARGREGWSLPPKHKEGYNHPMDEPLGGRERGLVKGG